MRKSIIAVVISLFTASVAVIATQAQQPSFPPFTRPQTNPLERRPRVSDGIIIDSRRYRPYGHLIYGYEENWPDIIITPTWQSRSGQLVTVSLMALPTKKEGLYFIIFITENYKVGLGVGNRPLEYLKSLGTKVTNNVQDLSKPYIIRNEGNSYTLVKNSDKAERAIDVLSKWWYDYQLLAMKGKPITSLRFANEDLYDVLDMEFPKEWWWKSYDPQFEKMVG